MSEETIGVLIAAMALVAFLFFARRRPDTINATAGTTPPVANTLGAAIDPDQFDSGPSYFIANQPYYFAPPVGNIMPPATASNTIVTNVDDGGCGCG